MYIFKSEDEEERFNKSLNDCLEAFKQEKSAKKLKKAVDCNLRLFQLAQLNHRRGLEDFYNNLTYELQLVYNYLCYLYESGLYEFQDYEISVFKSFLRENKN